MTSPGLPSSRVVPSPLLPGVAVPAGLRAPQARSFPAKGADDTPREPDLPLQAGQEHDNRSVPPAT